MSKVVFNMTMSLNGFISDKNGDVSQLYPDLSELGKTEIMQGLVRDTGAVVMGLHTFQMAPDPDAYAGNYEYQVPIFVVTNHAPQKSPKQTDTLTFTFVTDGLKSAIRHAKIAAGDKQVTVVGGANIGQQLLRGGLVDELHIGVMPVLLGQGLRLFDHLEDLHVELKKLSVTETGERTDMRFAVKIRSGEFNY